MRKNLILNTDSYKLSHWMQYPKNTENVFSYIEARGFTNDDPNFVSKYHIPSTIFFGLQAYIKEYLMQPVTWEDITEADKYLPGHGVPWNREGWVRLIKKHHGKLPIIIKAVPEGSNVPLSNVLVTIEVTDPEFYWLTSYLETSLLRAVWYPTSVATISNYIKRDLIKYWKISSDEPYETLNFKLHDFGARGVSSNESAAIGGAGHLLNFMGTDTIAALIAAKEYYHGDNVGFSIPAAEHSTITTWGKDGEAKAYENMMSIFPEGLVAVVSDSYDIYNAVENIWGDILKAKVENRKGIVIIRPDSGDPISVPIQVISKLMDKFGFTVNSKGYRVLPSYIRVIQGDGINRKSIQAILAAMDINKMSIDNIAFGMGGALLQHSNRDTFQFAMKASAIKVNNEWKNVFKDPIDSNKKSKRGRLDLIKSNGEFKTVSGEHDFKSELITVFENGSMKNEQNFDYIKNVIEKSLNI